MIITLEYFKNIKKPTIVFGLHYGVLVLRGLVSLLVHVPLPPSLFTTFAVLFGLARHAATLILHWAWECLQKYIGLQKNV